MNFKTADIIYNLYRSIFYSTFFKKESIARIEGINHLKKEVTIHLRGVNAPICLSFEELLKDDNFIKGFSSLQASYIGYYYGLYYFDSNKTSRYPTIPFDCFNIIPVDKYTIYIRDRQGNIVYLDQISGIQNKGSPIQIMLDKNLIIKFPPLQSCYIGILSGIDNARSKKQISIIDTNDVKLKIV